MHWRRFKVIAVCVAAGIIVGIGYFLAMRRSGVGAVGLTEGETASREAARAIAGYLPDARRADVPVALIGDYFEHGIEHTPPRDPTGAMQRRERFYRAPTDPFGLLESRLGKDGPDAALGQKVEAWRQAWMGGGGTGGPRAEQMPAGMRVRVRRPESPELVEVEEAAGQSSLSAEAMLEIGRAFDFLDGDDAAAAWFRAGLIRAQTEFEKTQPGDPKAMPLLRELDETKALWRLNDYPSLEKRFGLAMKLNAPLSVESRRAGCLHATAIYYQGRASNAADAILKVWDEQKRAGDLGVLEKSDFGEMDWVTGLYLYSGRRYDEAIPYYRAFLATDDNRKRQGVGLLVACLMRAGKLAEADEVRRQYGVPAPRPAMTRPGS